MKLMSASGPTSPPPPMPSSVAPAAGRDGADGRFFWGRFVAAVAAAAAAGAGAGAAASEPSSHRSFRFSPTCTAAGAARGIPGCIASKGAHQEASGPTQGMEETAPHDSSPLLLPGNSAVGVVSSPCVHREGRHGGCTSGRGNSKPRCATNPGWPSHRCTLSESKHPRVASSRVSSASPLPNRVAYARDARRHRNPPHPCPSARDKREGRLDAYQCWRLTNLVPLDRLLRLWA